MKKNEENLMSIMLASFLKEHKILRQFKYNASLHIFKDSLYKNDKIMNYINPKYSGVHLISGCNIFVWRFTDEGGEFWNRMDDLWYRQVNNVIHNKSQKDAKKSNF